MKQEYEKQEELKRSALRAVVALLNIADAGMCQYSCTAVIACTVSSSSRATLFYRHPDNRERETKEKTGKELW